MTQSSKEAFDFDNRLSRFALENPFHGDFTAPTARRGVLSKLPWRDSYWPFFRSGIAFRYNSKASFDSFESQRDNALADVGHPMLSPAEKYDLLTGDSDLTLTRESWQIKERYEALYPDEPGAWAWMGICSGWAPAAISVAAPRNPVLARIGESPPVLFFEGDLRGLWSKAYDTNATTEGIRSLGLRCEESADMLPRSHGGRPIDGWWTDERTPLHIVRDYARRLGVIKVTYGPESEASFWIMFDEPIKSYIRPMIGHLYEGEEALLSDLAANRRGANASASRSFQFFKTCRDVNPGALHAALVAHYREDKLEDKTALVLELNRHHEVWNFPVVGFATEVSPLQRITRASDLHYHFRAAEAAFIAKVETRVYYSRLLAEPSQSYIEDSSSLIDWDDVEGSLPGIGVRNLSYSLEFDQHGRLVGGEWSNEAMGVSDVPDFFWQARGELTDAAKGGGVSLIKASLLRQLLACSQAEPNVTVPLQLGGGVVSQITAVECRL